MLAGIFLLLFHLVITTTLSEQDAASDFQDLGRLLLIGFVVAVAAGVAFTVIRIRLRDKKPPVAEYTTIANFRSRR